MLYRISSRIIEKLAHVCPEHPRPAFPKLNVRETNSPYPSSIAELRSRLESPARSKSEVDHELWQCETCQQRKVVPDAVRLTGDPEPTLDEHDD